MLAERCSCSAKISLDLPASPDNYALAKATILDWRANHRHEAPEPEMEIPTVIESGSSHERATPDFYEADRAPIGFRA